MVERDGVGSRIENEESRLATVYPHRQEHGAAALGKRDQNRQARGRIWSIARNHLASRACGKAGKRTHQREPDEAPFLLHTAHDAPFAAALLEMVDIAP